MRRTPVECKLRGREMKILGGLELQVSTTAASEAWAFETMPPWNLHWRVMHWSCSRLGCFPTLRLEVVIDDLIVACKLS